MRNTMEMFEERFIQNLKSQFYDIMTKDMDLFKYESILVEMLTAIKQVLNLCEAAIYTKSDSKPCLIVEASTLSSENKLNKWELEISESITEICEIKNHNSYGWMIPLKQDGEIQCYLILKDHHSTLSQYPLSLLQTLGDECSYFLEKTVLLENLKSEKKRYQQLFRVTEKVHSTMNMESILNEIIESLREIYPGFTYHLILSQDHEGYETLPIKEFDYDSKNKALMEAYVTGTMQFEDSLKEKKSILYAPLKGKQGVYGVLQMMAPDTLIFSENEKEFISLLAKTAGVAMENAQLYEQSKRLIVDLQLINETSQRLNSNLRLTETMEYLSEQIILSLGAEEVGFILLSAKLEDLKVQLGSTDFFFSDDAKTYIEYVKKRVIQDHEAIFIGNFKWPINNTDSTNYQSMMVVPMLQGDQLIGFVIVLHRNPYAFSFETFKLLKSLVHHSTLAFTNTILREELEKMVITDHLTKLYSRNYLDEKIKDSMNLDGEGTFIIIDIDNFKAINDTYGHQIGDKVIIQVAQIIQDHIRSSDIGARWGGEELAIYLPRVSLATGVQIAKRLVKKVRELSNPQITISCGVSHWKKEDNDTYNALFKRADQALYKAKETGKNKVVIQQN